ncbi:MAG: hypothetical protein Q7J15_08585 [Candidatus Desulfaltia sp.]|nr:hypothetical protein [Candidatus Desulfaltia sp.]
MNPLFEAGLEIQNFMLFRKWPFCFIGGLAVIRWGEVRMTQDIDVCILSGFSTSFFIQTKINFPGVMQSSHLKGISYG